MSKNIDKRTIEEFQKDLQEGTAVVNAEIINDDGSSCHDAYCFQCKLFTDWEHADKFQANCEECGAKL